MVETLEISFTLNGKRREARVSPGLTLVELLRDELDLTGTKIGCGKGECGACTVIVNGDAVDSCLMLAYQVDGAEVLTIEGLASGGKLDPLQQAFVEEGAIQCGYCTPGMVMSAKALLNRDPAPTEGKIREALAGNLCRCTGYTKIIRAVQKAGGREDE